MLKVDSYNLSEPENIPEEVKEELYIRGNDDYRTALVVTHNDKIIYCETDGGEPEDNSFGRDWGWVFDAIEYAYNAGLEDAKNA